VVTREAGERKIRRACVTERFVDDVDDVDEKKIAHVRYGFTSAHVRDGVWCAQIAQSRLRYGEAKTKVPGRSGLRRSTGFFFRGFGACAEKSVQAVTNQSGPGFRAAP